MMNQQRPSSGNFTQFRNGPALLNGSAGEGFGNAMASSRVGFPAEGQPPPPLPPRAPRTTQPYHSYMPSTGFGGSYGYGNNWAHRGLGGGYSMYGGYGNSYGMQNSMYGSPYGGGPSGDVENRFVQFAEESSRPAFQSIESVVQTFTSISMMMESTFFAMTSSFRAILSVAENVSRVKNMFGQLLSTFALVRLLKWLYRKIAYTIGLNGEDPNAEQVWKKTAVEVMNGEKTGPATWPILLFISLLIGIPYMINKLLSSAQQVKVNENDPKEWLKYNEPVYSALVVYDFNALSPEELSVKRGEKIWLAPQSLQPSNLPGWSKATNNISIGLVPSDYVRIVGKLLKKSDSNDPQEAPVHMNSDKASAATSLDSIDPHMTEIKLPEGISTDTESSPR